MALASEAMKSLEKAESKINNKPVENVVKKTTEEQPSDIARLKAFIDNNHLGFEKNGKKFVTVEAWQFLAQIKGLLPTFESEECNINGVYAVRTTCDLRTTNGLSVSKSTMIATADEVFLSDKDKFAVWGMSETRAFARSLKNIYGYLLVALGFQATPGEEITEKKGAR